MNIKTIICTFLLLPFVSSASPVANFGMSVTKGCVPVSVSFTNTSTGNNLKYEWVFGNGNKSVLKDPSAIYYTDGNYTVSLTVTDDAGKKSTKEFKFIEVYANPEANLIADPSGCVGSSLKFKDNSKSGTGRLVSWIWDFGDGTVSHLQNTDHSFSQAKKYSISLVIKDINGCKSQINKKDIVEIFPLPQASFSLEKHEFCGNPTKLRAQNQSPNIESSFWECTNGTSGQTSNFETDLTTEGDFTLKLTVTSKSCTASTSQGFKVRDIEAKMAKPGPACVGFHYQFSNQSGPYQNMKYYWDFGDGETSDEMNPKHLYKKAGEYYPTLIVETDNCRKSVTEKIIVNPPPSGTLHVKENVLCSATAVAEFSIQGEDIAHSTWTFRQNQVNSPTYYGKDPILYTYYSTGEYSVKAIIVNSFGCAAEVHLPQKIYVDVQSVNIKPEHTQLCIPESSSFHFESKVAPGDGIQSAEWIFEDDNSTHYGGNITKRFEKAGEYKVHLKVKTNKGCTAQDEANLRLGYRFKPEFILKEKEVCSQSWIKGINTTKLNGANPGDFRFFYTVEHLSWNTDPNTIPVIVSDSFLIAKKFGTYKLGLSVDHFGCISESSQKEQIKVNGPFTDLKVKSLNCKNNQLELQLKASYYTKKQLLYKHNYDIDTLNPNISPQIVNYKGGYFEFEAWNDSFNCYEKQSAPHEEFKVYNPQVTLKQSPECAPSVVTFSHNGTINEFEWQLPGGGLSHLQKDNMTFYEPGKFKFVLTGYYEDKDCIDTNVINFTVKGEISRSSVQLIGECHPLKLLLYDSTFGSNDSKRQWRIDNKTIDATGVITEYTPMSYLRTYSFITVTHLVRDNSGCTTQKKFKIQNPTPVVDHSIDRNIDCREPLFHFKSTKAANNIHKPIKSVWEIDDSIIFHGEYFNRRFEERGMHYAKLTVTNAKGCQIIYRDSFEVSPNMLQPLFDVDPKGGACPPLLCHFSNYSKTFKDPILKYEWDFGDGTTSILKNPDKLYLVPGEFTVTLKITSTSGCEAILVKPDLVIVNGPKGSYSYNRGEGCIPHTVHFKGTAQKGAKMEWDLGDGMVRVGNNFDYIYKHTGKYIPSMILSDSFGCKYTLPPIDTIYVYDKPIVKIQCEALCFKQPIRVNRQTLSNHRSTALSMDWYLNGENISPGMDSLFYAKRRGPQQLLVYTQNKAGCIDTTELEFEIFAPEAIFVTEDHFICLGQVKDFINQSKNVLSKTDYTWGLGDGNFSGKKHVSHQYKRPGIYPVLLVATDSFGCVDSMFKSEAAIVGDTLAPKPIRVRKANVINDRQVEFSYMELKSFDFDSYTIYKKYRDDFLMTKVFSKQSDTVFYDNLCYTPKNSYCYKVQVKNLCGFSSDLDESKVHCTIESSSIGELEKNEISWTAYKGFDSIARYEIWRADEDNNLNYYYLDFVDGHQQTYTDTMMDCHTRKYYKIQAHEYGGLHEISNSDSNTAKPYFINTNTANTARRATVENNELILLEWYNDAWSKYGIKGYLISKFSEKGEKINNDLYFDAHDTSFRDLKVRVAEKNYIYKIRGLDNCLDTTPFSHISGNILLKADFDPTQNKPVLSWSPYQEWPQGVGYYVIERKVAEGIFTEIGRVDQTALTFTDMQVEENCMPYYVYRVKAVSEYNAEKFETVFSHSNEAVSLPYSRLFVPNAFTPNKNALNELFVPVGQYVTDYKMQVFNKWGEKIFFTEECMQGWDGTYQGQDCMQDVYMYRIEAKGADGEIYILKGSFHLFR